jgi:hypothetical protein
MRLNDVVHIHIQTNGMNYVCDNYIVIREEYYSNKEQRSFDKSDNKESSDK